MRRSWKEKDGESSLKDERKKEKGGRKRRGVDVDDVARRGSWVTGERSEMVVEKED